MSNGLGRGLASLIPNKNQVQLSQAQSGSEPADFKEEGFADIHAGEKVYQIPPAKITPNPMQARADFNEQAMKELAGSIKQYGILEPLIATKELDGTYQLIAGERRLRAARKLGLKAVPVILRTSKDMERLELSLIENIQRQDLNPLEKAKAYTRLIEEFGLTHEELAKRVGRGRGTVTSTLRLLKLPEEIKRALIEGKISEGHAKALLTLDDPDKQLLVFNRILEKHLTVRDVEQETVRVSNRRVVRRGITDPNILDKEERLQSFLGTRVYIRKRGARGTIWIEFYSDEELNNIIGKITEGDRIE